MEQAILFVADRLNFRRLLKSPANSHCYITFIASTMLERVAGMLDDVPLTFFVRNDV